MVYYFDDFCQYNQFSPYLISFFLVKSQSKINPTTHLCWPYTLTAKFWEKKKILNHKTLLVHSFQSQMGLQSCPESTVRLLQLVVSLFPLELIPNLSYFSNLTNSSTLIRKLCFQTRITPISFILIYKIVNIHDHPFLL